MCQGPGGTCSRPGVYRGVGKAVFRLGRKIKVRVKPRSSRPRVEPASDGECEYLIFVRSAAQQGKANAEVLKAVSQYLGIPKSGIRIVSGERGRIKILEVD